MEQRSLRLGDIVDDYCPRERRITNHAIVAIVEDAIRLTRCTTCDHEHQFKDAREPRRRRKSVDALYDEVLADVTGGQLVAPPRVATASADEPVAASARPDAAAAPDRTPASETAAPVAAAPPEDGWPAHRTLIRATLPRTAGEPPPPRPIPEFTMHQPPPRSRGRGGFRFGQPQGDAFGNARHGRPDRGSQHHGWNAGPRNGNGNGSGNANGNVADRGNGNGPGKGRRRRRGGKRNRS